MVILGIVIGQMAANVLIARARGMLICLSRGRRRAPCPGYGFVQPADFVAGQMRGIASGKLCNTLRFFPGGGAERLARATGSCGLWVL